MKPKFRIGDRVKTIGLGDEWVVAGVDPLDTRRVYVSFDHSGTIAINEQPWYFEHEMELVGCGIPAPALRWEEKEEFIEAKVFGVYFRIQSLREGQRFSVAGEFCKLDFHTPEEAKEACQAYWQELWDKEMLLSRENL